MVATITICQSNEQAAGKRFRYSETRKLNCGIEFLEFDTLKSIKLTITQ